MKSLKYAWLPGLLISVLFFHYGCGENELTEPEAETVRFEGRVYSSSGYEDIFNSGTAVPNAAVSVYLLNIDGSKIPVGNKTAITDGAGKFRIEADAFQGGEYILEAMNGSLVRKAFIKSSGGDEIIIFVQPLTVESTAEAEIYTLIKQLGGDAEIYDVALLIDADMAELVFDDPVRLAEVAELIKYSCQYRSSAFQNPLFAGTEQGLDVYLQEGCVLTEKFARDLFFAQSSSSIVSYENNFYDSYLHAMSAAGLEEENILELLEIYYRILLKYEPADAELKLGLLKSFSSFKARILNTRYIQDFLILDSKSVPQIRTSGEELLNSINEASDYENIKSAFNSYNQFIRKKLLNNAGVNENIRTSIDAEVNQCLMTLSSEYQQAVDAGSIIQPFIDYYQCASDEIEERLRGMYPEESEYIVEMMVISYINF